MATMPMVTLPDGARVPALGLGTWRMGEQARSRRHEVDAVRLALELGYRLIDTAEMYGEGGAERVVGEALDAAMRHGLERDDVMLVSKVLPHNASARGTVAACEASLRRLGVDSIDLYLLHWRGSHPLRETVDAMESLQQRGWIRHWGVSNFDKGDMLELSAVPGGAGCSVNQVYYSLGERGIEFDLLPWMRVRQMPAMAYSPIDQGALADHPALRPVAERHRATPAQVALAWVMSQPGVVAIPKSANAIHLRHNLAAAAIRLDSADREALDHAFPRPTAKRALAMT
jgi:diketogulonate reductase-like aldo/keto reductase